MEKELDEYRDVLPAPRESAVLLTEPPRYVEAGSGKVLEREASRLTHVCDRCGHRLVEARALGGQQVTVDVTARTWRLRLDAKKTGFLAERGSSYPEHHCRPERREETTDGHGALDSSPQWTPADR